MNEQIENYRKQLTDLWSGLSKTKKTIIAASTVLVIVGLLYLAFHTEQKEYGYLFTDLDASKGARIVSKLEEENIPYKITSGGTAIMVPKDKVYEIRMKVASEGLTLGGDNVGFELFDKSQFGVTNFVQKVNFKRALEGELARTISSLKTVRSARVHLVLPERKLFRKDKNKVSASVMLDLSPGAFLGKKFVAGIRNLVSSSVPGLKPDNVTILDTEGEILTDTEEDSELAKFKTLAVKDKMERDFEYKISKMLEKIVGKGKVAVRVTLNLDFTKKSFVSETYNPDGQVVRSEKKHIIINGKRTGSNKGIPGSRSNLPGGKNPSGLMKKAAGIQTVKSLTNYEIDKTVTKVEEPVLRRKSISVAVVLDGHYIKGKNGAKVFKPLSKSELVSIEKLVKKAVGYNPKNGDQIEIQSLPFSKPTPKTLPVSKTSIYAAYIPYMVGGGISLFVIILLFFLVFMPKYKIWKMQKENELKLIETMQKDDYKPLPVNLLESHLDNPDEKTLLSPPEEKKEENLISPEQKRSEIIELVQKDMDRTVAILKNWISA